MSSSSSDTDSSDDEMRKRLLESVTTVEKLQNDSTKEGKIKQELIKVGPYNDIELSKQQIQLLINILNRYTENLMDFRNEFLFF